MTKISGGVVSVEDGTKKNEEFTPARKVRVELRFDVIEGEDAETMLAQTAALADGHVKHLLGQSREVAGPSPQAVQAAPVAKQPGKRATKAAETAPVAGEKPAPIVVVLPPEPKTVDPMDDFSDTGEAANTVEITDKQLHDAMTHKAAELNGNPEPIKAVVKQFRPASHNGKFGATDIPRTGPSRQNFLDALKAAKA